MVDIIMDYIEDNLWLYDMVVDTCAHMMLHM